MKKITALILGLIMVWNMGQMCALAETNQAFLERAYQEQEGKLDIICAIPGQTGNGENFQAMLGENNLPVLSVSRAGESKLPKTIYCLVDISGSMKGRIEQVKETLTAISGGLNEGDNLVIGRMGNQITDSAFLTGEEEIKAGIDGLGYTGEDTDLYSGLMHGLKFLQQESGVNPLRALVVLSDGCDDQGAGSTWKEAYEAVEKADIPVYTVAVILSEKDYEPAKELGSFARNSAGGMHFPKSEDGGSKPLAMTGQEMGAEILAGLGDTFVVSLDLTGVQKTEKDAYLLSVTFRSESGTVYEDSLEILAKNLQLAAEPETQPESRTEQPAPEPEPSPEPEKKGTLPRVIGGAALVLAAAAAVIAVRSKKKKAQAEQKRLEEERLRREQERLESERLEAERLEQERLEQERLEKARQEQALAEQRAREEALRREREAYAALPKLNIRLSAIGITGKNCTVELARGYEVTVGRNAKARVVLDSKDTRLSGVHFTMLWDGRSVYVWDSQSKNGTSVNGVVVNQLGKVAVRPGDSLRAGSYEYRLYWED
ncbi:MAG: VWA domain-containing protein [Enterocloster asparagiformis]|nr:VWA domain-containing protein [Enterocloster asparagiformis]